MRSKPTSINVLRFNSITSKSQKDALNTIYCRKLSVQHKFRRTCTWCSQFSWIRFKRDFNWFSSFRFRCSFFFVYLLLVCTFEVFFLQNNGDLFKFRLKFSGFVWYLNPLHFQVIAFFYICCKFLLNLYWIWCAYSV